MKRLLVISADPGKTSGIAFWRRDESTPDGMFESIQVDVEGFYTWMTDTIGNHVAAGYEVRIVSESFIITVHTAKNTQAAWSLELIGVLKYLAHMHGLADVKLQSPSVGKTFGTDSKLRHIGWHRGSKMGHANDAARHLITYCASNNPALQVFTTETLMELATV